MKRFFVAILVSVLLATTAFASNKATQVDFLLSQVRNTSGSLGGGTATFYAAGTTTLKTVWTNRDKTVSASNPYTLDANGTAQIYADGLYKIVVKNAAGTTIYTRDNVAYGLQDGPWTDVAEYASLTAAGTAIGSTQTDLLINSTTTLTANTVIPANIRLKVSEAGRINQGAYTLTINGPFDAPISRVFTGTGSVILGEAVGDAIPHWWYDGGGDWTAAFNAAFNCRPTDLSVIGHNSVYLPTGHYRVNTALNTITGSVKIHGDGPGTVIEVNSTGNFLYWNPVTASQYYKFKLSGVRFETLTNPNSIIRFGANAVNPVVEDVYLHLNTATYGILVDASNYGIKLNRVSISDFTGTAAIRFEGLNFASLTGCDLSFITGDGIQVKEGAGLLIDDTVLQYVSGTALHLNSDGSAYTWQVAVRNSYFEQNGTAIDMDGNGSSIHSKLAMESIQFNGTNPITLGTRGRISISDTTVSGANNVTITGSASASAQFKHASGFLKSGTFSWTGIGSALSTAPDTDTTYPTTYTPAWTASVNPSLGNGTLVGYYSQTGHEVHVTIKLTFGSTTTPGTGQWSFSLPFVDTGDIGSVRQLGTVMVQQGATVMTGIAYISAAGGVVKCVISDGSLVGPGEPWTWANGDAMDIDVRYWTVY